MPPGKVILEHRNHDHDRMVNTIMKLSTNTTCIIQIMHTYHMLHDTHCKPHNSHAATFIMHATMYVPGLTNYT